MSVLDSRRIAIKLFAEPTSLGPSDFVDVFHRWIQTRALPGVLVDVTDYSHVHDGPGVMLVGHEATYAMDRAGGRLGLEHSRRRAPPLGDFVARLRDSLRLVVSACALLERDERTGTRIRFRGDELVVRVLDRRLAPNDEASFDAARLPLEAVLRGVRGQGPIEVSRGPDPGAPLTLSVRAEGAPPAAAWLAKLE